MSHLIADAPAISLGAGVGVTAGLYACRALRRSVNDEHRGRTGQALVRPASTWLLAIISGAFGALVGARFGLHADLPAYLELAAIAPVLGLIDAATRTLPNRILLPAYPLAISLLGLAAWRLGEAGSLWRALMSGAVLFAAFLLVALAAPPGSLGWGDVKLVGFLGLFAGFLGWTTVFLAMMIAFGTAAVYVLVRRLIRREMSSERSQTVPLGPTLLIGTLVAVIIS